MNKAVAVAFLGLLVSSIFLIACFTIILPLRGNDQNFDLGLVLIILFSFFWILSLVVIIQQAIFKCLKCNKNEYEIVVEPEPDCIVEK